MKPVTVPEKKQVKKKTEVSITQTPAEKIVVRRQAESMQYMTSEHIQELGISKGIADTIMKECGKAPDMNHCVKSVLGVAAAESGMFKSCSITKNCHGVMTYVNGARQLKRFSTYEAGVADWIQRYIRNKWYVRETPTDWIDKGGYCNRNEGDGCRFWAGHFLSVATKIDNLF